MTARKLGLSASTVSRRVVSLETRLGVALVRRTTRTVRMTSTGLAVASQCRAMVAAAERAETLAHAEGDGLRGDLVVNAPTLFGRLILTGILFDFANRHRDVKLRLLLSNQKVDLEAENVDLVIRTGDLPDSSLRARRLATAPMVIVATPGCIARHGHAKTLAEVAVLPCIAYDRGGDLRWICGSKEGPLPVNAVFVADDNEVIRDAALAGVGFALLPRFTVSSAIKEGRLVALALDCDLGATPLSIVFPSHKIANRCAHALANTIIASLKKDPSWK